MQIRGLARITLAPLTDTLPCLGAVQISLLEEPYIDFSISLFGSLDLMLLPILKDAVNFAANKVRYLLYASPTLDRHVTRKVTWLCYSMPLCMHHSHLFVSRHRAIQVLQGVVKTHCRESLTIQYPMRQGERLFFARRCWETCWCTPTGCPLTSCRMAGSLPSPRACWWSRSRPSPTSRQAETSFQRYTLPLSPFGGMHPFAVLVMLTLGTNTWGISVVQVRNVLSRSSGQACPFSRCEAGLIFCALVAAETFVRYSALRLGYWPVQLNCVSRAQVDPFVDMSVRDGRSQCTKTIWNNKDPVFNQVLSFIVNDPEHQSITAMVKDDDMQAFSKVRLNAGCNLRCHM